MFPVVCVRAIYVSVKSVFNCEFVGVHPCTAVARCVMSFM